MLNQDHRRFILRQTAKWGGLVLLLGIGAACDAGPATTVDGGVVELDAGTVFVPPAMCGDVHPGPVAADVIDFEPGYEQAAAAALEQSPPTYPVDLSEMAAFQLATVNFMLGRNNGDVISQDDIDAAGPLGDAVAVAIAAGGGQAIDFRMLRRGLSFAYLCSRPLPPSLEALEERVGRYWEWDTVFDVGCSRAKNEARSIYIAPDAQTFVAETVDDNGSVRETEVLFRSLRTDGHLDFAAYTADGVITDRSSFATPSSSLVLAAPYTCLTCHIDQEAGTMSRVDATGTGAGCQ